MAGRIKKTARDVKTYPAPQLIHNYDRVTGRGPLHVADKYCLYGGGNRDMTRCGRFMRPDYRGFRRDETLTDFRLCQRCGTEAEFIQAVADHAEWWRQWTQKNKEQTEREQAERQANWEATVSRVKKFAGFLIAVGLRVGVKDGVALVEFDGYEYEINESGRVLKREPIAVEEIR